jgi:hypothetical protein
MNAARAKGISVQLCCIKGTVQSCTHKGGSMEAELIALAAAGATTFVQQMAADSWAQARDRIVSFLSRHRSSEEDLVEAELETSRGELVAAMRADDEQTPLDVETEWRTRLRRTLLANPDAASELQAILDDLAPQGREEQAMDVQNTISGGVQHGPVIQAGHVGTLNFGTSSGLG